MADAALVRTLSGRSHFRRTGGIDLVYASKSEHVREGYQGYNWTKIVAIKCRKVILNCPNEEEVRRSIIKGRACDR